MREATVTIFVKDDGTVDLTRFGEVEELKPVKELIDSLRKENGTRRRDNERLTDQVSTLEGEVEELRVSATSAIEALKTDKKAVQELTKELGTLKGQVDAYAALGTPEELTTRLSDADYGRQRKTTDRITEAAQAAKLNPSAVLALQGVSDWRIEYREVEEKHPYNGSVTKTQVPFVVRDAEGKDAVPFRDEILTRFAPLASSLTSAQTTAPAMVPSTTVPARPDPVTVPSATTTTITAPNTESGILAGLREVYGN